jgi:hypothetical protein
MISVEGLVGAQCFHFGGDETVSWIVEVDTGSRGEATGDIVQVRANGGDMYVLRRLVGF